MQPRPTLAPRPTLNEDAATYIRGLIVSGRLRPGEPVRAEAIGEELGISGTPVREALQALRVEGFLEMWPRKGYVVAPLTTKDIRDLFTTHALLAGELASRAAELATPDDVAELEALHKEILVAEADGRHVELLELKAAFHRKVHRIAASRKIEWAVGIISTFNLAFNYAQATGWPEGTTDDYADILEAIRANSATRARAAMHAHIIHAGELLAEHFDKRSLL